MAVVVEERDAEIALRAVPGAHEDVLRHEVPDAHERGVAAAAVFLGVVVRVNLVREHVDVGVGRVAPHDLARPRDPRESEPDGISPLDGRALVARKVKRLVSMACAYPRGKDYNSMWDWKASKVVFESWPTPIVFSDWQYGGDLFAGRAVAEMEGPRNPVKDVFAGNVPSRDEIRSDPAGWQRKCFGMGGRAAWDETAVLAAVRGEDRYFNVHRGTFRMIGEKGEDEWIPDEANGRNLRLTEKVNKLDVGKVIDELICRKPKKR